MKKLFSLITIALLMSSCKENTLSLESNAETFFFLSHKEAYMPIWVEGNTASKVFLIHVHGGPGGESLASFNTLGKAFTDPLEEQYANVYYDQRNSGSSQGSSGLEYMNEEQFAEDLFTLIKLLKGKYGAEIKVFPIGSSWGGRLVVRYLLNEDYRKEVTGWISLAGAVDFIHTANAGKEMLAYYAELYLKKQPNDKEWQKIQDWSEKKGSLDLKEDWDEQNDHGWQAMALTEDSTAQESSIRTGDVFKTFFFSPVNLLSVLTQNATFPEDELVEYSDISDQLPDVHTPSLLLYGKFDFVVPPAVGQLVFDRLGTSEKRFEVFEASNHNLPFNETSKFIEEVVGFVNAYK